MALTDWVFPEMGYTCEQDKRALYEKEIAPVYSGVTDNRSRVAEGNFCHTLVLSVKISGKRKGDKQMKPYLKAEEIRKDIREQLPVIDEETFREHYCSECMYYAGRINKKARCMQRQCSWDKDDEFFALALKRMIPILDREYKQAEEQYLEAKRRKDAIHEMFAAELLMERKKKDPFYKCAYNRNSPCIGFCYQQMTAHPVDPNERL